MGDGLRGLDGWLEPFLDVMGRTTRREWAPFYVRGLLGPGERKSLQPMAARRGLPGHDQLRHFVASTAWDGAPLRTVLAQEADRLVGGPDAVLVIDGTVLPKKGEIALAELAEARSVCRWDRVWAAGVAFGCVLADAAKREAFARGYGMSAAFRHGLSERQLAWAVGIPRTQPDGAPAQGAETQRRATTGGCGAGHRQVAPRGVAAGHQGRACGALHRLARPGRQTVADPDGAPSRPSCSPRPSSAPAASTNSSHLPR